MTEFVNILLHNLFCTCNWEYFYVKTIEVVYKCQQWNSKMYGLWKRQCQFDTSRHNWPTAPTIIAVHSWLTHPCISLNLNGLNYNDVIYKRSMYWSYLSWKIHNSEWKNKLIVISFSLIFYYVKKFVQLVLYVFITKWIMNLMK